MRTLIVDDEQQVCETLTNMLNFYCPDIDVLKWSHNVSSGVDSYNKYKPELMFLDVNMPDGDGFDLLKQIDVSTVHVAFVSGFDKYAVQAFRANAIDYLLKPVDPDQLQEVARRARKAVTSRYMNAYLNGSHSYEVHREEKRKLLLKTEDSIHLIHPSEILHCESDGNYTRFHLENDKEVIVSRTLKHFESRLEANHFFRIHRSHLINLNSIESYDRRNGGFVILRNGTVIPVASRKKDAFLARIEQL